MDAETLREYCLKKTGTTEDMPFGPDTLAFRVQDKIYALVSLETFPTRFNAKCDPERALKLREEHPAIVPGYHMNKTHWNTVVLDGSLPDRLVESIVDESYDLIVASLPRKQREALTITS